MTKTHEILIGRDRIKSNRTIPVMNPFSQESVAEVCLADGPEIEQAIDLADQAFKKTRTLSAHNRSQVCSQVAQGILNRHEEFARTIATESGKPLIYARAEVSRSINTFEIASQEALRLNGESLTLDITKPAQGKWGITRHFPIGPVSGISPFNFPLNLVAHKVAPALACGNPIILKPASSTPLTALLLGEVILESDAVTGSFSVLPCSGKDAAPLVEDPRLKMITFTGSPPVGWDIKARAGKKKVVLELGGNAAVAIEPDADLDLAAKKVSFGAFVYSGQVCISVQRVFVHSSCLSDFSNRLIKETQQWKTGDPLDETVTFGPMIDQENAERIDSWVQAAVEDGAKILTGGQRDGAYYSPTILTEVPPRAEVSCNEAFGPIMVLEPYNHFQEALDRINDSDYGLQAGIFTNQFDHIMRAFQQLEVGGVIVNDAPTFRVDNMPYGGVKDSGFGREGIKYSMEEMTELKLLVTPQHAED